MSRIGKKIIVLPQGVTATTNNSIIYIKGQKGELSQEISNLITINLNTEERSIQLTRKDNSKKCNALHGLYRSLISNMVMGVSQGFEKKLTIQGVGYRSQNEGKNLILNVGYSHPVNIIPPENIDIKVENNINLTISGINKETVGQVAAKIRAIRPPEPYKGKGIRYENETVRRKVGKAGK